MILILKVALKGPKNDVIHMIWSQIILKTLRYPYSAVTFECRLLSVEPDYDYEIEKLC